MRARLVRSLDRALLGPLMAAVAYIVERELRRRMRA
jgi:hypothetical protein